MELRKRDRAERAAYLKGYLAATTFCVSVLRNALEKIERHARAVRLQADEEERGMGDKLANLTPEERVTRICSQHEADIGNPMFRPTGEYSDTTKLVADLRDADRRAGALEELRALTGGAPLAELDTPHGSPLLRHVARRIAELEGGENETD